MTPDVILPTPRQMEVLRLLDKGLGENNIARELSVSLHTVRSHIGALRSYFDVRLTQDIAPRARAWGLVGETT